jgi:hypothetical protein
MSSDSVNLSMSIFMAWNSVFSTDTQYAAGYLHDTQSRGSGALSSVACALLVAFRFESLVKLNDALRDMPNQGQGQKDLLRYSLMDKPRNVPESARSQYLLFIG